MQYDYPAYTASIHHDGSRRYVSRSDPHFGDEVILRLRAGLDAPIDRVFLRVCPDGEQQFIEMQLESATPVCRWWRVALRMSMPVVTYRFLLLGNDGVWWHNASGLHRHTPTDSEDFRLLADYAAPVWVRDSVFYQIFPDRFASGDSARSVRDSEFEYRGREARTRRWGDPPSSGPGAMLEFYGGDLAGIEQHLGDLLELGVNALYLTPIFTAYTSHRYDVVDYENVDPHLGGNAALASLRRTAADRGLRLILDIVPNHCGVAHPWFQAAAADASALTAEFFTFYDHPYDYACWLGARNLPKLNYRSATLRETMYAGQDAVFRRWLRPPYAIDGWRIDAANMLARQAADQLGPEIGRGIRHAVKEETPSAYLLGENFFDSGAQLQGDCWDATMNYTGFMQPLIYWLKGFAVYQHVEPRVIAARRAWSAQAMVESWQAHRAAIPWAIARQQYNLLGSHDTPRILASLGSRALNRLAAGLLMTYVGVPGMYYGEEIGLKGDSRECMLWDRSSWDEDLRGFYRALAWLRRASPALIEGGFQVLQVEDDWLAYLRDTADEQMIIIGQRGPEDRPAHALPVEHGAIPDGVEFVEIFSGMRSTVADGHLPLPSMPPGVWIWRTRMD